MSEKSGPDRGGKRPMPNHRDRSHDDSGLGDSPVVTNTRRYGVGMEEEEGHNAHDSRQVYVQFSTPMHQEVVFLGEVTIPVDHLFLEGSVLLKDAMVNQLCVKCTLTVHWRAQLKGAANRPGMPGMHPVTIPLPTTLGVSRRLAGLMLGAVNTPPWSDS